MSAAFNGEITVRGEIVHLLPEAALFWPRERALVVADFHLGKAETFGQNGLPLPAQAQNDDLAKLGGLLRREDARRVIFLGDLVHSRKGLTPELQQQFAAWMRGFSTESPSEVEFKLVAGNHDQGLLRRWPAEWHQLTVAEEWNCPPFRFQHEPPAGDSHLPTQRPRDFIWAGHVHPCVRLRSGADQLRLKTFVVGEQHGLLPAFSSLAGGFDMQPDHRTRFYALGGGEIFEIRQALTRSLST